MQTFVGPPSATVRRQILLEGIQELHRTGVLDDVGDLSEAEVMVERPSASTSVLALSPQALLRQCVTMAEGCSCRLLKKLPFLAFVRCEDGTSLSCHSFLVALRECIRLEVQNENRFCD